MDILASLRTSIESLPSGNHSRGLRAVLSHIETGHRHFSRGQRDGDDTAFTDAIYRCNQAFEGSVKEAYRVLASKDPAQVRPYDIEQYLEENAVFRDRVLALFTNYRREWRNPSTHDYSLDFNESEAFLAIISVTGFAKLLVDQISQYASAAASKAITEAKPLPAKSKKWSLTDRVAFAARDYMSSVIDQEVVELSESGFIGAFAGYLEATFPNAMIDIQKPLGKDGLYRPDLYIRDGGDATVVGVKRGGAMLGNVGRAVDQLDEYVRVSGAPSGVVLFFREPREDYRYYPFPLENGSGAIVVGPVEAVLHEGELPLESSDAP